MDDNDIQSNLDYVRKQTMELRARIRVNVIQKMYNGFVSSFQSVTLDPDDIIQGWMSEVPGFSDKIEGYVEQKNSVDFKYTGKWSLKNMSCLDRNSIISMFDSDDVYTGDECEFCGPNVVDMYVVCAIFLYSRKRLKLPKTKKSDKFGLWAAFCELFSDTAANISQPNDRKRVSATCGKKRKRSSSPDEWKQAFEALEQRVHELESRMEKSAVAVDSTS